jgi:hypothetical protein
VSLLDVAFFVMLSVAMLSVAKLSVLRVSVVLLSVVMVSVVIMSVVAPIFVPWAQTLSIMTPSSTAPS